MPRQDSRVIMLADCQSFYASVEKSAHPEYKDRPLVVAGDPARRSGIILAACPLAKSYGITTAERLGEALAKCPDVVVVRPRMAEYIRVSLHITRILQSYTDLVEPYSIDEQFLDVTGSLDLFGSPETIARSIQSRVMDETGVYIRIGISDTKVVSKMACDLYAKKSLAESARCLAKICRPPSGRSLYETCSWLVPAWRSISTRWGSIRSVIWPRPHCPD